MSIQEEVAAGVANAMGPIADHLVASVSKELQQTYRDLLKALSGKEITVSIKLPDLTK